MYCPQCGEETHSGRKTCPNCGGRLDPQNGRDKGPSGNGGPGRLIVIIVLIMVIAGGGLTAFLTWRNRSDDGDAVSNEKSITARPDDTDSPFTATPIAETPSITTPAATPAVIDLIQPDQGITTVDGLYEAMKQLVSTGGNTINNVALTEDEMTVVLHDFGYYWEGCSYIVKDPEGLFDLSFDLVASRRAWKAWVSGDETDLDNEAGRLLRKAKAAIARLITSDMTDYEKELVLHDYIIDNCEYMIDVENRHTEDARGFFDFGTCQCSGYADTFWLLGTMAGLEVGVVHGKALEMDPDVQARYNLEDSGHAWNLIRLDGLWYGLDLTWDDPVGDEPTRGYTYFNVPTTILSATRTWNALSDPGGLYAQDIDDNYYLYRRYNKEEYLASSTDEALRSAISQIDSGGEAIIAVTDKPNVDAIVDAVANKLMILYNKSTLIKPVIWIEDPIAEYLPFYIYQFEMEPT